jgi:hypothetical protein
METQSQPLTFGELKVGDEFIAFPLDGDDRGHGGYRSGTFVFLKVEPNDRGENALKLATAVRSTMPDSMRVLKVLT